MTHPLHFVRCNCLQQTACARADDYVDDDGLLAVLLEEALLHNLLEVVVHLLGILAAHDRPADELVQFPRISLYYLSFRGSHSTLIYPSTAANITKRHDLSRKNIFQQRIE